VNNRAGKLTQAPGEETGQAKVSKDIEGSDDRRRTRNSVQGGSDGFDVLPTTSIVRGFQLLDKVGTGWTCAIDDVHEDPRWRGRPREGIREGEVKGRDGNALVSMASGGLLR
jgi:hypothetical protein